MLWYLQCWGVSFALARSHWYWLSDWNTFQVIILTRLHAMYQRSRKILIFLIVGFLAVNIFNGVVGVMTSMNTSGGTLNRVWQKYTSHWRIPEEVILSGTYQCYSSYPEDILLLDPMTFILGTVWEFLTLCLAVWIAVKHFRELRQHSAGGIIEDCYTVLTKTHMLYFATWAHIVIIVSFFFPTFSTVCKSLTDICMRARFIISIVPIVFE
jgi:hypothetical protein